MITVGRWSIRGAFTELDETSRGKVVVIIDWNSPASIRSKFALEICMVYRIPPNVD